MTAWPQHPVIHEINTWVWIDELRRTLGADISLADVPPAAWDEVALAGVDAVWLMGVWERSPVGREHALASPGLRAPHREALPDLQPDDVVGSAYCVRDYRVDERLGGDAGLAAARAALAERGVKLIVDYVPNHVARDHGWVQSNPEYFVHATPEEARERPGEFVAIADSVFALGRDPYFAPWTDVVQLNAFDPGLRDATARTLLSIAQRADGVRCDMAMLALNDVFASTWGERVGAPPSEDFWPAITAAVRDRFPDFLFLAEVYWGREPTLLEHGFDYCYDKGFYDIVVSGSASQLRDHLRADVAVQARTVRFLENHDEPRAAATLPPPALPVAAVVALTVPGAALLYEGQLTARRQRPPVALGRRPQEAPDEFLRAFYLRVLAAVDGGLRHGRWRLCDVDGWDDNATAQHLLAWLWDGPPRHLVVANWSPAAAAGRVRLPAEVAGVDWELVDLLSGVGYERAGDAMVADGLYVELPPWGAHLFGWEPT